MSFFLTMEVFFETSMRECRNKFLFSESAKYSFQVRLQENAALMQHTALLRENVDQMLSNIPMKRKT